MIPSFILLTEFCYWVFVFGNGKIIHFVKSFVVIHSYILYILDRTVFF